jgi:Zn-dependent protease with chaperone function
MNLERLNVVVRDIAADAKVSTPKVVLGQFPFHAGAGLGNKIFIDGAFSRCEFGPYELASVIAHEIGHLRNRDPERRLVFLIAFAVCAIAGIYLGFTLSPWYHAITAAVIGLAALTFKSIVKMQEFRADVFAVTLVQSKEGMLRYLSRLRGNQTTRERITLICVLGI